jgi:hypothetical protein
MHSARPQHHAIIFPRLNSLSPVDRSEGLDFVICVE